jgi:SAM-dependent methyltransferase
MLERDYGRNQQAWNGLADKYLKCDLFPPERELLIRVRDRIRGMDMLDLGCGAGRTTYTFAALAKSYLGVDYAQSMIDACRGRFGESETQRFRCLDATDLSSLPDAAFDLILFSFASIDYVDLAGREKALAGVKRLLAPGGVFFFSSHSLESFPWRQDLPAFRLTAPESAIAVARQFVWNQRRSLANRGFDLDEARKRGWASLQDGIHRFGVVTFYGTQAFQLRQLQAHGFAVEARFAEDGRQLSDDDRPHDITISYLCRHGD